MNNRGIVINGDGYEIAVTAATHAEPCRTPIDHTLAVYLVSITTYIAWDMVIDPLEKSTPLSRNMCSS